MLRPLLKLLKRIPLVSTAGSLLLVSSLAAHAAPPAAAPDAHPAFQVSVTGDPAGRPIILIPGLASSGEVWKDTVAHYCGAARCHVLTLAGFAGIPPVAGPLLTVA